MSVRFSTSSLISFSAASLFAAGSRGRVAAVLGCAGMCLAAAGCPALADAKNALPPVVGAFKMTKPVETFSPGTLENHIDGQAESVKRYDFKQCDYAIYAPGGQGAQVITVDIFEMGSPLDSYGYYSYQLAPSASRVKFVKIGPLEAYQMPDSINFWKGPYYVVVTNAAANAPASFGAALPAIAQAIAAKLSGAQTAPPVLGLLPSGRIPHSERFQRSDIFAQSFLKNGVVAAYPPVGPKIEELFVAQYPSTDAARQAYGQYQAYLSRPLMLAAGAKPMAPAGLGDSAVSVKTKFGQVVAAVKGKTVAGVRNATSEPAAQALVKAALAKAK